MEQEIEYLKQKFPNAEVFASVDKDFICVRSILGQTNFGKNSEGKPIIVPITNTERFHVDTVRLKMTKN